MISSHLNYTESRFRQVSQLYMLLSCSPKSALKLQIIFCRIDVHRSERRLFFFLMISCSKMKTQMQREVWKSVKPFTLQNL